MSAYYDCVSAAVAARRPWRCEVPHDVRWFGAIVEPVGEDGWQCRPESEDPAERAAWDEVVAAVGLDAARTAMVARAEEDMR